ncbi:MAG: hypothetical protein ACYSWQ_15500 [Planctomycetota bacterium]|jgi:hypothetical protein
MAVENQKDWIDILTALLTPTIAISAVFIGGVQCWINRKRLKTEYFDRRITVYEAIAGYISGILTSGMYKDNDETKFLRDTKDVFFLFGSDIRTFVDEIYSKSTDLRALQGMERTQSGDGLEDNLNRQSEIKHWFNRELRCLQERFKKYLSL